MARSALRHLTLSLAAALAFFHGVAAAADTPVDDIAARAVVDFFFDRLDCDLRGSVAPEEVDEHLGQTWHPTDRDQSRLIDEREYLLAHHTVSAERNAALFRHADADGSGGIDSDEWAAHLRTLILQLDVDGNNEASIAEAAMPGFPTPHAAESPEKFAARRAADEAARGHGQDHDHAGHAH